MELQYRPQARAASMRARRGGKTQKHAPALRSRALFDEDEDEEVVQEGDKELVNEEDEVVLVEEEAEEGALFPNGGNKQNRRRQDETQLSPCSHKRVENARKRGKSFRQRKGILHTLSTHRVKGTDRPAPADYRGARAAGQCRGQFQLFSHQRAARRRAHVTTGVVAATSHYRRARSYLSFGPQPADMSENRLQRVAKDGAGWIHNPGWNIVLSVPTGAGPSVGVWRSQLPSGGGGRSPPPHPQCGWGEGAAPPV